MTLDTKRLELVLLTPPQLRLFTEDLSSLEHALNCHYCAEPLEGHFLNILKSQCRKAEKNPENCVWLSFFLLIRKEDRVVVGSADYKHPPDENGAVEIGYGLGKAFTHCGYMTEAVEAMCIWAKAQPQVTAVIAETEPENVASQNVLKRCGFRLYRQAETLWWKL